MRKFKIDKNTSKKILTYALMSSITLSTFVGCNNNSKERSSFLSDTILENTSVITFEDGHKDLATIKTFCDMTICKDKKHKIYNSIVTNEYFSDDDCHREYYIKGVYLNKYNVINEESIVSYLTVEEIVKASKNKLTNYDISNIIIRIFTKDEEQKSVQKVK